jgi:predicted esterase
MMDDTMVWIRGLLTAVLLPAVVAGAAEPVVPPAAELGPLLARYEEFAALSPDERARTKRPEFDHPPLSKEAAAAWKRGLWVAWKERLATRKPDVPPQKLGFPQGWLKPENAITVGVVHTNVWTGPEKMVGVTMRYGARTAGKQPAQGWPVFINLHGGGDNPQSNDAGWVASMNQYPVQTGLCISPRSPVNTVGSWNDPLSIASLERLLVELPAKWDIDRDRIYLMGYSMGAIGVLHIGPSMPDRWAAVAASAGFGYLGARGRSAPENLFNLPLMIQIGTADRDFQRYPLARAFATAVRSLGEKNGSGYRIEFKEHPGKGHMIDDRDTPGWLAGFRRAPLPERIIWHQPMLPLPLGTADTPRMLDRNPLFHAFLRRRCYWLRNDAPAGFQRVDVSRAGNEFRIDTACHIQRLTFLLDNRFVDATRRMATALPDDAMAQINAAELLLNTQPESLRDPPAALECAGRAMKLTGNKNPQVAGLLALAQFRNGRRAEAVATVKAALALVPADRLPKLRADLEAALETYGAANAE